MSKIKLIVIIFFLTTSIGIINFKESFASDILNGIFPVNTRAFLVEKKEVKMEFLDKGTMTASWYGPNFHGRLTANGEVFNQNAFTAAHKSLPFGTLLRITNPSNGLSVVVRINDRGPYFFGRNLDLSKNAANALGMIDDGVIKVKVEEIITTSSLSPILSLN